MFEIFGNAPTCSHQDMGEIRVERARRRFHIKSTLVRDSMAEFFCTFWLMFMGNCVSLQNTIVLNGKVFNEWIGVAMGWGMALIMAVYMGHRTSGAHLNPAVTLFQVTQGKCGWNRFFCYTVAQFAGAFCGSLLCFLVYYDAINAFDGGVRQVSGPKATAGIFSTYPAEYLTLFGAIFDQIVTTMILCMGVGAISDKRNNVPPYMQPLFVGVLIISLGFSLGMNSGYAMNPARDFGPRVMTLVVGYGWEVISYRNYGYFWIPIVFPMISAVAGAWLYEFIIGFHMPDDEEETDSMMRSIDDRTTSENGLVEVTVIKKALPDTPSRPNLS